MRQTPSIEKDEELSQPGQILREWLVHQMHINSSYSLRAMSKKLGVSPGFLSQIMNGKKVPSFARALQFSQLLKLNSEEADELLRAVAIGKGGKGLSAQQAMQKMLGRNKKRIPFKVLELEKFKALSRWYHIAILDLMETVGFRSEPSWIARRLKISPLQVKEAIERLSELGLIEHRKNGWRKAESLLALHSEQSVGAIREHHQQMIAKAQEHLLDTSPKAFDQRSITGMTLCVDPKRLPEAFERIDQFRRDMQAFLSDGKCTEVFQLNVQLFNLSHFVAGDEK